MSATIVGMIVDSIYPFPVERRQEKIANLFVEFCDSGDPVKRSLIKAFSLLVNP
jgi:hypothetical protein